MSQVPILLTVGVLADRLAEPLHRVEYVLRTRRIPPTGLAGKSRVYDDSARKQIAEVLHSIDRAKGKSF
jgi:hypothetical protein